MTPLHHILSSQEWESKTVLRALCSRTSYRKSVCEFCKQSCPTGSIEFKDQYPEIDANCSECGTCISVCPNGVFLPQKGRDIEILSPILSPIRAKKLQTVVYGCKRSIENIQHTATFNCLGRLTESLILAPLIFGAKRMMLVRGECSDCENSRSIPNQSKTVATSKMLAKAIGIEPGMIELTDGLASKKVEEDVSVSPPSIDRRNFFGIIKSNATSLTGKAIASTGMLGKKEDKDRRFGNWKRDDLLALLSRKECRSEIEVPAGLLPAAEVSVGPQCVGCQLCHSVCPTKSITVSSAEDIFELSFDARLCIACGNCERACRFGAIRLNPTYNIKRLFEQRAAVLVKSPLRKCEKCGAEFINSDEPTCQLCQDRTYKHGPSIESTDLARKSS